MKTFFAHLLLQYRLLLARLLPRFMVVAVLLAATLPILLADPEESQGFRLLADTSGPVVTTIMLLSTILAAVSFAGDASSGALRTVLIRPLSRGTVVLGQAVALMSFVAILYLVAVFATYLLVGARVGYEDVTYQGYPIESLRVDPMAAYARLLILLPLPAVLCAPVVSLLVASLIDDVALAVVLALTLVMGPYFFSSLVDVLPEWVFTEQAAWPVHVLVELSRGSETEVNLIDSGAATRRALLIPLACGSVALALALFLFRRRDYKS